MRDPRGNYTLDELLDAKRAEKPSPDFWAKFEDDLRIKQRRLLQKQPVDDLGEEVTVWHRFRNFGFLCGAATSCGVVGFVVMQLISPEAPIASREPATAIPVQEIASNQRELSPQDSVVETASEQPVFFEVVRADNASLLAEQGVEPVATQERPVELASSESARKSSLSDHYVLEIETPFQSVDIDKTIAFNADENITSKLMERYVHPLSDRGWKYTQIVSHQADPLNRVTAMALESKLFGGDSRSEIKWNALTLKF